MLIDLERLSRGHGVLGRTVVKDLAAIEASVPGGTLSCRRRARFLQSYLGARGFPARLLLGPLLRRVVKKAASIRRHVPRTPVGDAARPARASASPKRTYVIDGAEFSDEAGFCDAVSGSADPGAGAVGPEPRRRSTTSCAGGLRSRQSATASYCVLGVERRCRERHRAASTRSSEPHASRWRACSRCWTSTT